MAECLAQYLNLEHELRHHASELCILGFEPPAATAPFILPLLDSSGSVLCLPHSPCSYAAYSNERLLIVRFEG